jgi:hypothetical protein
LERARALLARQDGGSDEPVIGTMHLPDPVGMVTGWCLVDLAGRCVGEIDHACALTAPLLDEVAAVCSATVTTDLRRLARVLARYAHHPSVRRLGPRLGTLSRLSTS